VSSIPALLVAQAACCAIVAVSFLRKASEYRIKCRFGVSSFLVHAASIVDRALLQTIQKEIGLRQVLILLPLVGSRRRASEGLIKALVVASKIPVKVAQVGRRNKISR